MNTYPKIDTLFEREGKYVNPARLRRPEFKLISEWVLTEKIDGTNIRLRFARDGGYVIEGRSDNASIPAQLGNFLRHVCEEIQPTVGMILVEHDLQNIILYGEGFGPKINNGGRYSDTPAFALFDVNVGNAWLDDGQVTETAERLGLTRVPVISSAAVLENTVDFVRYGFTSHIAQDATLPAEGIVARPAAPLYDRRGERVMWKLKTRDFERKS